MLYLLAVVGALTIAVLLWRSFGPDRVDTAPSRRFVAPDDDPDFLRKLGEQRKKKKPEEEE
ncbi:hypothetical protein [Saccharothrix sp. Mg75]|uniref:hypothetical protein n=1 Tax=Saccharothrix sp. Mg75 TaxID=3445357 RepID=UPI003EF05465